MCYLRGFGHLRLASLLLFAATALAYPDAEGSPPQRWTVTVELAASPVNDEAQGFPISVTTPGTEGATVVATGTVPGLLKLQIPEGAGRLLRFEVEGIWCPELDLGPAAPLPGLVLTCYPTAVLTGRVITARGIGRPTELIGTAQPSPDRTTKDGPFPKEARFSCPVDAEGLFECPPPAGRFDLRLKAYGFAGHYLWDVHLGTGERRDIGTVRAAAGASLVGEVQTADGSPLLEGVEVWLEDATRIPGQQPAKGSLRERRMRVRPGRGGFFQFEGLRPGPVLVSAQAPGYAGGEPFSVDLREGLEATLRQPLTLSPPVGIEVLVTPPHDPQAKPWKVRLSPRDPRKFGAPEREGKTAEDGSWRPEVLPAGEYTLELESERGDRWHRESVEVLAGGPPIFVNVPVIHVHGTLERNGEPVSAHLWFGGLHGSPRVHFFAEPDGRFHGYLPRAGRFKVVLQWPETESSQEIDLPPLDVEEPDAPGAVVEVAMELPTGEVWGEVVDEIGEPVTGVSVTGIGLEGEYLRYSGSTDADGRFEAKPLIPGRYQFFAQGRARKSSKEEVEVSGGGSSEEIRLVMGSSSVRGRVISAYGPVVGAGVDSQPVGADGRPLPSPNVMLQSDLRGSFEIGVPPEAAQLAVMIFPEGYAARALLLPPSDEEARIEVGELGGTLILEPRPGHPRAELLGAVLRWNGAEAPLFLVKQRWADLHGGSEQWPVALTLPRMEPAVYEFCSSPVRDGKPVERRCVSGVLAPNAELRLSLAEGQGKGATNHGTTGDVGSLRVTR